MLQSPLHRRVGNWNIPSAFRAAHGRPGLYTAKLLTYLNECHLFTFIFTSPAMKTKLFLFSLTLTKGAKVNRLLASRARLAVFKNSHFSGVGIFYWIPCF